MKPLRRYETMIYFFSFQIILYKKRFKAVCYNCNAIFYCSILSLDLQIFKAVGY